MAIIPLVLYRNGWLPEQPNPVRNALYELSFSFPVILVFPFRMYRIPFCNSLWPGNESSAPSGSVELFSPFRRIAPGAYSADRWRAHAAPSRPAPPLIKIIHWQTYPLHLAFLRSSDICSYDTITLLMAINHRTGLKRIIRFFLRSTSWI